MKGIRKMDEMELQITLRASRAAWFFLVLALVVWSVWEAFHGGDTTLPAFLLGVQAMIFCLVQWIGRARVGDDRVKREFVLWVILTVALVAFSLLLVLGMKNRVKELRKARGLRQEDVAALLGVSRQTVNAVENDRYGPTLSLGMKLARLLETPVEELFTLDG